MKQRLSQALFSRKMSDVKTSFLIFPRLDSIEMMRQSRELLMSSVHEKDSAEIDSAHRLSIAASSGLSNNSDLSSSIHRRVRRVTFATELVTSVIVIPSCLSMLNSFFVNNCLVVV